MKLKNSLISISLATFLVGCGSSNNSSSSSSGGSSTDLAKSSICLDTNLNGKCDSSEKSQRVSTWDKLNPIKTNLVGSAPLVYEGEDGYIFTAPAGLGEIYAGTTLLNNELIYNQVIETKTTEAARAYVLSKFGGDISVENKKDIAEAIKNATTAHPNKNPHAVIAAVVNKIFADTNNIKDITVTDAEINAADVPSLAGLNIENAFDTNTSSAIAEMETKGWADPKDTEFRYLSSRNGKLIGGTKEHNGLAVVDLEAKTIKFTAVSVITDCGHGILSPSVDANSGASEPSMNGAKLTSDGSHVYFNVPARVRNGVTKSNTNLLGLFKVAVAADGSIDTDVTELPAGDGQIIVAQGKKLDKNVVKFALASDDSKVAVYDDQKVLHVYNGDLDENALGETDDTSVDSISSVAITATHVYTASSKSTKITKRSATGTLSPLSTIDIGFTAKEIFINSDDSKMLAFSNDHVSKIALIDLANDTIINEGSITFSSDGLAVSPDFETAALFGHEEKTTKIINLSIKGLSIQGVYDTPARSATFISNDKLATTDGKYLISVINITKTNNNISLAKKIQTAKNTLNKDKINSGGDFDAVIKNLSLSTAYENVNISWSENGLGTNLLLPDGNISRPANDTTDVSGVLSAGLLASFRGEDVTGTKDFNINIRKTPANLGTAKTTELGNRPDVIAVNKSGTIAISSVIFNDLADNNKTRYGVASFVVPADENMTEATTAKIYHPKHEIKGLGISGTNAIIIDNNGSTGNIFSVALANDALMADSISINTAILSGEPKRVDFNSDKSLAAVLIQTAEKKILVEIYDTDTMTQIGSAIDMGDHNYYTGWQPLAINEDASRIYLRESSGGILHAIDSSATEINSVDTGGWSLIVHAFSRVFAIVNNGTILSFNEDLGDMKKYSTGVGSYILGAGTGIKDGNNYLYFGSYRSDSATQGVYQLKINDDGTLNEIAFAKQSDRVYGMTNSSDNNKVFFSLRGKKYKLAVITAP